MNSDKVTSSEFGQYTLEEIKEDEIKISGERKENSKFPIALVFDKGEISTIKSQTKVHMKGVIFLSMDYGEYPKIPAYDQTNFDTIIKNWALEYLSLDHYAPNELQKLVLYPSVPIFYFAPNIKPWNKKAETFLKCIFLHWSMDNFLTSAVATGIPLLTKEHYTDFIRFIINIMTGMYRNTDGIPNCEISFLNTALKAWFAIYLELKEHVAGYEKFHCYLLKEIVDWIQFYKVNAIYMGSKWEPHGQPFIAIRKLAGRKFYLELIQFLTAAYVDEVIREHVLFQMFVESADLLHNMVYDIFSLDRPQKSRKDERNLISKCVKDKGMSLEAALNQQLSFINHEINDFRKVSKGLAAEFPSSDPLQKYIQNTMFFVDGTVRYLAFQTRYGKCESKIMKVCRNKK